MTARQAFERVSDDDLRANLETLALSVQDCDVERGLSWYSVTHGIVTQWSRNLGYSVPCVAATVAAISPQCAWPDNLITAYDVLLGRATTLGKALPANVAKARHIVAGHLESVYPTFQHAPKVESFAANLAGDLSAVTVDTHAVQAALADATYTAPMRWPHYARVARAYRDVAESYNLAPADFQAIIWCAWKRQFPRVAKNALKRANARNRKARHGR